MPEEWREKKSRADHLPDHPRITSMISTMIRQMISDAVFFTEL
jgi:hypothetical protein